MSFIFLSHILGEDTPSYGNRDKFVVRPNTEISEGATANTSSWSFTNNHFGTHIDLPYHFYNTGKQFENYNANSFVFNQVCLIDIPCNEGMLITVVSYDWDSIGEATELLLIRTGFEQKRSTDEYWQSYPGISEELCKLWRNKFRKLRCIGFDFISLTSPLFKTEGKAAHQELLKSGNNQEAIFIVEDMSLKEIDRKVKRVIVAPIRVENGNGGPVTIIAEV